MSRARPYLILLFLWAAYFHPLLLHPAQTLFAPYSDFLAEHLPAKLFLNREWRATGELPLWNPYHFCGTPFVHDIQVGAFYPPNAIVYLVPATAVGAVLSWAIALHLLAAGVFTYIYARSHQLNEVGSTVAAVGFMLSSKWMTHLLMAGHTVTAGLAWLPLVLLGVECGIANRSPRSVVGAGVALALLGLGTHPQWAFYAVAFALAWTVPSDRTQVARWLACWAGAGGVAVLLGAVQLIPTMEAARWSARSGGSEATGALTVGLQTLFRLVGPARAYAPPASWEMQGVFGLFWLGAAAAAPVIGGGRGRGQFGVLCGLFVFSVGGAALLEGLPGFDLFRVPTRMLLIAAFPLAVLAGATADAVVRAEWAADARLALARGFRRATLFAGLPTVVGLTFSDGPLDPAFLASGLVLVISLPLFVRVLQRGNMGPRSRTAVWCGILLVELVTPVATLPAVRPQAELYPTSPILEYLKLQQYPLRVLDRDVGGENAGAAVLGIGAPQAMVHGLATPRGYDPLDVRHYREFIAYVVDDPRPVRGNSPYTQQVLPNFEIGNPDLFRLLGVTHSVAPPDAPVLPGAWVPRLIDPAPPAPPPLLPASPDPLPSHALAEAADPRPRAWIVPHAEPLGSSPLAQLKTGDFSRTVFISGSDFPSHEGDRPGTARVGEYRPNRVAVDLDGTGGWLVFADVWFPGWGCRVDGVDVPVYRGDHAFRAVPVPVGAKLAEFTFEPVSYRIGWWVSAGSLGLVVLFSLGPRASRPLLRRSDAFTKPR